jgi:hypothetical protein
MRKLIPNGRGGIGDSLMHRLSRLRGNLFVGYPAFAKIKGRRL